MINVNQLDIHNLDVEQKRKIFELMENNDTDARFEEKVKLYYSELQNECKRIEGELCGIRWSIRYLERRYRSDITTQRSLLDRLFQSIEEKKAIVDNLHADVEEYKKKLSTLKRYVDEYCCYSTAIRHFKHRLDDLSRFNNCCALCRSPLTEAQVSSILRDVNGEFILIEQEMSKLEKYYVEYNIIVSELQEKIQLLHQMESEILSILAMISRMKRSEDIGVLCEALKRKEKLQQQLKSLREVKRYISFWMQERGFI